MNKGLLQYAACCCCCWWNLICFVKPGMKQSETKMTHFEVPCGQGVFSSSYFFFFYLFRTIWPFFFFQQNQYYDKYREQRREDWLLLQRSIFHQGANKLSLKHTFRATSISRNTLWGTSTVICSFSNFKLENNQVKYTSGSFNTTAFRPWIYLKKLHVISNSFSLELQHSDSPILRWRDLKWRQYFLGNLLSLHTF